MGGRTLRPVDELPSEDELRRRLVYWVDRRLHEIKSNPTRLATALGVPRTTLSGWLDPKGTAPFPMHWLGRLCGALDLEPRFFATLKPIPEDPFEGYRLPPGDVLTLLPSAADVDPDEAESVASELAREDFGEGEASDPRAALPSPSATRKRGAGARR